MWSRKPYCCSVTQLCSTLQPNWLQHARFPCPSLSPRVCSNSCALNRWCHPNISSSAVPFSPCFQSFPIVYWKWKVVGLFIALKYNSSNKNTGRHIILDQAVLKGEKQLSKLRWNHRWFSLYMSNILKIISKAGNKPLVCYCCLHSSLNEYRTSWLT